jgi:hypothetical protein
VIETLDDGGDAGESCDPGEALGTARAPGCATCRFECPDGAIDDAGHCYFLVGSARTFQDAVQTCANASAHLVTFASEREALFVGALARGRADTGHWVGLSKKPELGNAYGPTGVIEPGWPSPGETCPGCFAIGSDGGAFAPYPDGLSVERQCLVARDGAWLGVASEGTLDHAIVCEREPVGQRAFYCGGPYCTTVPVTAGSKRYVISVVQASAAEANELCRTAYASESLVMFDTREEREQLARELGALFPSAEELWIGLRTTAEGEWTWEDGVPVGSGARPLPWGSGEPATPSGRAFIRLSNTVDTQLARGDADPLAVRRFVCQRR